MFTLTEIFAILIIHWIADFVFQAENWALGKSKNLGDLFKHTITYTCVWFYVGIIIWVLSPWYSAPIIISLLLPFILITFVCHTITDYFTSRIVSKQFANKHFGSPIPNFGGFTTIGWDQLLHYGQLFLTYYWLRGEL